MSIESSGRITSSGTFPQTITENSAEEKKIQAKAIDLLAHIGEGSSLSLEDC